MPKEWTLTECFKELGATLKNPRTSWSAISDDRKTVILTMWKDQLDYTSRPIVYDVFNRADLPNWTNSLGNRERIEHLRWAKENCDGWFRVIITVAKDVNAKTREIERCYPLKDWWMRLIELNEKTGEFRAVKEEKPSE
jgi:hypothetical protein